MMKGEKLDVFFYKLANATLLLMLVTAIVNGVYYLFIK